MRRITHVGLSVVLAIGAWVFFAVPAHSQETSDATTVKMADGKFERVLERIRAAAESGDWKVKGWNDPEISAWITQVQGELKTITKRDDVRLPVSFKAVAPVEGEEVHKMDRGLLVAGSMAKVNFASNSILLSDGCLYVGFADNCILIARGAINATHSGRNFIAAGQHVDISHEGGRARPGPGGGPAETEFASVVLSGGTAFIGHATKTICLAPRGVSFASISKIDLINSPVPKRRFGRLGSHEGELSFDYKTADNPLKGRVEVTRAMKRRFAYLKVEGKDFVIPEGGKLVDDAGKPLPGLQDWKLEFVCDTAAIFSDGKQYATFFVER